MIPPAFLHDLLARVDIVEVVGRQVQLKKAGVNHKGLCPFHGEKSPSFIVSPSRQTYHCFGCGVHGNAVGFLMENAGLGFVDAVRDLAQQAGMAVPEDDATPAERERASALKARQATLSEVLAKAAGHYRRQLKESDRAVAYLRRRGLSGEIANRFGLGYAPDGWRSLASAFSSYDDPLLEESGMVIAKDGDGGRADPSTSGGGGGSGSGGAIRYDRFRDRIMFPIRSVQGDVIGFGGRILDAGEPKYLNSPETPIFSKGRELYGLHEARTAVRQRGHALVVEGYMDVVALAQSGFDNAVATLGTACTVDHVQKLFRFTDKVVFSFDGDVAGRRAAGRALEASLAVVSDVRSAHFLFLPPEHDPDSYVREHGAAAFQTLVDAAVPLSRHLVDAAADGLDLETAEGRARLLARARPLVAQLAAGVLRAQIVDALAAAARVAPRELRAQWDASASAVGDGARARPAAATRAATLSLPARRRPLSPMASSLDRAVWMLIQRADLWEQLGHDAHDLLSEQPSPYGDFFAWFDRLLHDHGPLAAPALLEEMSSPAAPQRFGDLTARVRLFHDVPVDGASRFEIGVILDRLRLQVVGAELELLSGSEGLSDLARQRQRELYRVQADLKKRLSEPSRSLG